jgi:hypothetical protein
MPIALINIGKTHLFICIIFHYVVGHKYPTKVTLKRLVSTAHFSMSHTKNTKFKSNSAMELKIPWVCQR